jgi:DNA-binding CsgD family transcriptional regulator
LLCDHAGELLERVAAADAWERVVAAEPRAYRPALTTTEAADVLRREANAGRLAGEAVDAVLESVGEPARPVAEAPAGLTLREVEVLRMLARGMTNKQTGQQLEISPKTVGRHVESIYSKIGASTRAAAAAPPPSPPVLRRSRSGPTAAARSGSRRRSAACSGSSPSVVGSHSHR